MRKIETTIVTSTSAYETAKLTALASQEGQVLFTTTSVFPFDFFPIRVTVERNKVDFVRSIFFASREVGNILISQISRVEESSSLFFSSLRVYSVVPTQEPFVAEYLPKAEAMKIRRIIEGLMVTIHEQIDPTKISKQELVTNLQKLGAAK